MTQTAVEWFQEQIIKIVNGTCELSEIQIFEKAKEMEKQQILNDYEKGWNDSYEARYYPMRNYIETYGGDNAE